MSIRYGTLLSFLLLCTITSLSSAQSDRDLRSRIVIDGLVDDYAIDEWVLDRNTSVPELPGDSRWGLDNDIRGIAVTWDMHNLYVAIDCSITNTSILLCIDYSCGGTAGLQDFPLLTRNISFRDCTPNLFVSGVGSLEPPRAIYVDCSNAPRVLLENEYYGVLYRGEYPAGALELSLPWELFPDVQKTENDVVFLEPNYTLRMLAAVSGGDATGAGDAAPNTVLQLDNDSTRVAVLDNHIVIPLDADGDGTLDIGSLPRSVVSFARDENTDRGTIPEVTLVVDKKLFAPDAGEKVRFRPVFESECTVPVPVTVRVYSVSGSLITVLYSDRTLLPGLDAAAGWEEWDGRDAEGGIVPGGIYIIAASVGGGGSGVTQIAKEAVAIIR